MPRRAQTSSKVNIEADHLFSVVLDRLRTQRESVDVNRLRQAFELSLAAHEGQMRLDGSPYIIHPLEVAELCVDFNMEEDAVIAAMLHDTVEDTGVRLNQIRQLFGNEVAGMVSNLTKIKRIDFFARFTGRDKASEQARNLQRLFVAMTRDTRVIVIKLADRLHNMSTLAAMPEEKRRRISRETLEFYIPIARRLGLGQLVSQLEDLVFLYLYPVEFEKLESEVNTYFAETEARSRDVIEKVRSLLEKNGIKIKRLYGRRKHLWSVFQKMQKQGVDLDGIYDMLAIRIIVDGQPEDCYRVLGLVHMHYKPLFHRFRDFIASPKENGYQTLHTTVIGLGGSRIECQIRTEEMDLSANFGIASHWRYKEIAPRRDNMIKDEAWLEFIRDLSEERVASEEFVATTRESLVTDEVLVLSPRGEVVNLPIGATPIDFAYYIHTDLGHAIRSAKINGAVVSLDYVLRNGDVVQVIKDETPDAPPRPEWYMLAKSPKSQLKIRRYFRNLPRSERIEIGRHLLRMQIVKEGLYPLNLTANDKLVALLRRLPVRSIDDIYDNVAQGVFRCDTIIKQLKEIHRSRVEPGEELSQPVVDDGLEHHHLIGIAFDLGLELASGKLLRRRAEIMRCCTPVPGDKLFGINYPRARRLEVHRVECDMLQREVDKGELIELRWADDREEKRYPTRISIFGINRVGLLFEILRYLSSRNINVGGAEFDFAPTVVGSETTAHFKLTLEVSDVEELTECLQTIQQMDDVFETHRLISLPAESTESRSAR